MTARLASIWRHPVKAIGREGLQRTRLRAGRGLPHDRRWAVTHARAKPIDGWAQKANFLRGVSGPELMAVTAALDPEAGRVTLRHPRCPDLTVAPAAEAQALCDWLAPLWPGDLPRPAAVVECATGFTDIPESWVSIQNAASHRAVAQRLGGELSIHRWRGNLWVEGWPLWHEFDLVGRRIRIGDSVLEIREPITRCKATMANPETGRRDADTLAALRSWDHQDFGVYAAVIEGGEIAPGAEVAA
ncbi:MOSC domain-containing protein [Jannaschia ovalis]|uniref:MOSC domain-containing protein n=1 Tax=Jannaschia ovalis TaxID=3038773 RepID=A0ABY8LGE1_9RHOB|nr:MOSC domain-containing protein [Jannaschia sp. GRR-S6-38]WGH79273.1 MOSC domain-containing protein [Jannaschia sp. GRR-S6-38]